MRAQRAFTAITALSLTALAAGCSAAGPDAPASGGPSEAPASGVVTVLTHDSFYLPDEVVAAFEDSSGIDVEFVTTGDGGSLANQIILTKGAPIADVVYGIDNTFASRVVEEGVLVEYVSDAPATGSAAYASVPSLPGLTPVDYSDVCINIDLTWFEAHDVEPPVTLEDLAEPQYKDLLVVTNPATSSPGLAFLLATVAAFGDDWSEYWEALRANGVRVAGSWSDAYYVDFSAPNYGGDRPIVLSYASSPPSEVIDGVPTSAALLDTCFRQVEYTGILAGTRNEAGAKAVIDWLLSDDVQSALPYAMYVYPVSDTARIPDEWLEHAPLADSPWQLPPAQIEEQRERLILDWTALVLD